MTLPIVLVGIPDCRQRANLILVVHTYGIEQGRVILDENLARVGQLVPHGIGPQLPVALAYRLNRGRSQGWR